MSEMPNLSLSEELSDVFVGAQDICKNYRSEYLMPEHLLLSLLKHPPFKSAVRACGGDVEYIESVVADFISNLDTLDDDEFEPDSNLAPSILYYRMLKNAAENALASGCDEIGLAHVIKAMLDDKDNRAHYYLLSNLEANEAEFFMEIVDRCQPIDEEPIRPFGSTSKSESADAQWRSLVTCINDNLENRNPLIGREQELETTLRILCRKDKNNVLHIGEPGVGKTALVYGLARMINEGRVPEALIGARIYQLDLGSLLAGTQFRGELEKRLKLILEGVATEEAPIVYIDEIHGLVGAGSNGESSMDASNMLKPYLETGKIRFIGSITYDEYKRHFAKSKGLVRRFTKVDIIEPSTEETVEIINCLKASYENFHGVVYTENAIDFAVNKSVRYITDCFLPDKAIDLVDEAGAYRRLHPLEQGPQVVDVELISEVLAKVCKVDAVAIKNEDTQKLEHLQENICKQIFGQNEAVKHVAEAVLMAKAGLTDPSKPLASLLFVGPTGVGKTEVARVLAKELGVELVRFDMSEYVEKHSVAKLIGSPAGYVGYEDGGQLVDAIRRSPNCVLLLDEIEKAHSDIYNILLQVMDYARLSDNKGNRADFSNVVLLMTSNAGAQYAKMAKVGFANNTSSGQAMLSHVKKLFKPEFINRLSGTVVFNDLTLEMASLILDKKLNTLQGMLSQKNVELKLTENAREYILHEGFTPEYGARELDRVISTQLKPVLMRAILFGSLKNGGTARIDYLNYHLCLN